MKDGLKMFATSILCIVAATILMILALPLLLVCTPLYIIYKTVDAKARTKENEEE